MRPGSQIVACLGSQQHYLQQLNDKQAKYPRTDEWINKHGIYTYSRIYVAFKNEWNPDIYLYRYPYLYLSLSIYNIDGHWKAVKWNQSNTKG